MQGACRKRLFVRSILIFLNPILVLSVVAAAAAATPDVHRIAQKADQRYNHLHTLQAQFVEIYRGAGMDRTESGTLWLKKPGKMRWEYRSPREKLFVSDGKDAWFYVPGDQQVRRTPVHDLEDWRSPLALLLGKTRLEKELLGLSFASDVALLQPRNVMVRGVPKTMADQISEVLLEITPESQISRIVLEGADGSVTEYRFSGQKEDGTVSDEQFHFQPPPGVEVVDGKLQP